MRLARLFGVGTQLADRVLPLGCRTLRRLELAAQRSKLLGVRFAGALCLCLALGVPVDKGLGVALLHLAERRLVLLAQRSELLCMGLLRRTLLCIALVQHALVLLPQEGELLGKLLPDSTHALRVLGVALVEGALVLLAERGKLLGMAPLCCGQLCIPVFQGALVLLPERGELLGMGFPRRALLRIALAQDTLVLLPEGGELLGELLPHGVHSLSTLRFMLPPQRVELLGVVLGRLLGDLL